MPGCTKSSCLKSFSLHCSLLRSVSAGYEESKDLRGIEVYRYTLQPDTLASPTVNPDNQCFCTDTLISRNCTMAGLLDVQSCLGCYLDSSTQSQRAPKATLLYSAQEFDLFVSSNQEFLSTSPCLISSMGVRSCERTCWASVPARSIMSPTWMWSL